MAQHALLSPSSAKKWGSCPGSVAMEEGIAESPSIYTDEGTAAHFLGSECLENGTHLATYLGKVIEVGATPDESFDGAVWADTMPSLECRHEFEVDTDMVAHVNTYIHNVRATAVGGELLVEQRLSLDWLTGEKDAWGTGDAVVIFPDHLRVEDLKYGQGVIVQAENNWQLMIYALAALEQYSMLGDFEYVVIVIHQPRVHHAPSEWRVSVAELNDFAEQIKLSAKTALIAYEFRANWLPHGLSESVEYLEPTNEGCLWCKAKATCPALTQKVMSVVADDFVDLEAPIAPQLADCSKRTMDPAVLANASDAVELVEQWCQAVRAKVFAELSAGVGVPRHKLVKGKMGNRAWATETEAEAMLKSMKLKIDEMYDMKVISPTSAEKIFGEKGSAPSTKRWNKLQSIITRKEGALSAAPESDPRPAVVIDKSADFADNTGDDLA